MKTLKTYEGYKHSLFGGKGIKELCIKYLEEKFILSYAKFEYTGFDKKYRLILVEEETSIVKEQMEEFFKDFTLQEHNFLVIVTAKTENEITRLFNFINNERKLELETNKYNF